MKTRQLFIRLFLLLITWLTLEGCIPTLATTDNKAISTVTNAQFYLAVFGANNDQKLYIYSSSDGKTFSLYSDTGYSGQTGVLRDPGLIYLNGKYYVAYTTGTWSVTTTSFDIASSSDLKNWTYLTTVSSGISGTNDTWAPDWFVDGNTVNLIVSLGPDTSNFRPYIFTAQNDTLTSWSNPPVDMNIGTNYIDAFVVKSGNTYHCFLKNETSKNIEHKTATSLTGPWTLQQTLWNHFEGPSLMHMSDGTWRMFIDPYTSGQGISTVTGSDLNTWPSSSSITQLGFGKHGSCIIR